jgi:tRNA-(ms[2]io[6]A)-hydroxylase
VTQQTEALARVLDFLPCRTPAHWFEQAPGQLATLLIDHANCEKKAAGTALSLMYRYVDKPDLLQQLSRLAREELRHFEQVHQLILDRKIPYTHLSSSRYAGALRAEVSTQEPQRLVDTLLVGAIVEARSCERFLGLVEVLPESLAEFYRRLLVSEARHFADYLDLARRYSSEAVELRLQALLAVEAELVQQPDAQFRFHSGAPAENIPAAAR